MLRGARCYVRNGQSGKGNYDCIVFERALGNRRFPMDSRAATHPSLHQTRPPSGNQRPPIPQCERAQHATRDNTRPCVTCDPEPPPFTPRTLRLPLRFTTSQHSPNDRISRFDKSRTPRWLDGNLQATIMPVAARKRQAGVAQLVEHHVANVVVEGSSPFTRSFSISGPDETRRDPDCVHRDAPPGNYRRCRASMK